MAEGGRVRGGRGRDRGRRGEREWGKNSKMAVCTLVKLEAYRERGSHMRRVATETKGGSEVLWDGGAVRSSTADAVCCGIYNFSWKTPPFTRGGLLFFAPRTIQWGKKYNKHKTARRTNKRESAHVTEKSVREPAVFTGPAKHFCTSGCCFWKEKRGKKQ